MATTLVMEARELRIGNLVLAPEYYGAGVFSKPKEVIEITSIDSENINNGDLFAGLSISQIAPIQLTEGWLLKLQVKISYYFNENGQEFMNISTDYFQISFSKIEIKFVHQLQNLYFALTGTELILNHN